MLIESAILRSLWWIIPTAVVITLALLERKWSR
jgi:hypothetical protein